MKSQSALLLATLVALLLAAASPVRADFLDWGYHWKINTPVLASGTGSVALAAVQDGTGSTSAIPAVSITTTSLANQTNPDVYHATYALTLSLTDGLSTSSKTSGTLTFEGLISGSLTATSSSLTNTFLSTPSNPLTQQLTLGQHVYTVTIAPTVTHLLAPGSLTPPLVDATVRVSDVQNNGGGGTASGTPEPASLVLGGLGFSLLGVGCWWKRTRRPERQAA
jgi:hypothetical protein